MSSQERDIKTISFGRACRDRLGMYLSADRSKALRLGLREIYVNSLDAFVETNQRSGEIIISLDSKNRTVKVVDNGPGIPVKTREDGLNSVEAAFLLSHTGSHFDERKTNAIGLNGVGAAVVNHTASVFEVMNNDGKQSIQISFAADDNGASRKALIPATMKKTGVHIAYIPDESVYGDAWFNIDELKTEFDEMMKFYPQHTLILEIDGKANQRIKYHYPKGLRTEKTKIYYETENLILSLSLEDNVGIKPFGNRLYLPNGGNFYSHFKTQLTKNVNAMTNLKLSGAQILQVFGGYVAIFVTNPQFSNQAKTEISNKEVNMEITIALKEGLAALAKTDEWKKIIKKLETEQKAEEAAEKAREKVRAARDSITKGSRKRVLVAEKLKDCIESGEDAWLAISEGNSAQGSLNLGRDINTVATFPIRGKFINCLKNTQEKFLQNEELQQIASILGCDIFEKYNAKKLKYGKVLIAVDADPDGYNIANLLMTFFYVCMPEFIQEGRLYWMKAPLYFSDNGTYIFEEADWDKVKNKKGFHRAKGLGELSEKAVTESLFGEQKRWLQLKPKNWDKFSALIEELMGTDVEVRRDFLFKKIDFENIKHL